MAFISASFSNRKIQSKRFTGLTFDSQEAFTSVFDIQGGDVLTDDRYIPTSNLPFSGSSQHEYYYTTGSTIESSAGNYDVLNYHYRHKLTRAANAAIKNETFYFLKDEPSAASDTVGSDGLISGSQYINFVNNKNALGSLGAGDAEDIAGSGLGYNVVVFKSTNSDKATLGGGDKIDDTEYVFDYKTGVLTFLSEDAIGASEFVYMTAYRYVGRTLKSQLNDGSLGGSSGVSSFNDLTDVPSGLLSSSEQIASDISGSLGSNATLIRSLTATGISGSFTKASSSFSTRVTTLEGNEVHTAAAISGSTRFTIAGSDDSFVVGQNDTINFISGSAGVTVLSNGSDTITIGASTDDVTFNSVTADTLTGTASFASKIVVNKSNTNAARPIILSHTTTPSGQLGYASASNFAGFTYNTTKAELALNGTNATDRLTISTSSIEAQSSITSYNLLNTNVTTLNFGGAATNINMGAAAGTVNIAGSASIAGDLTVQGAITSINTTDLNVEDQFILLNSGSVEQDGGIIVQTDSSANGTALFYDYSSNRWALAQSSSAAWNATSAVAQQYVVSVSQSAAAPTGNPSNFGSDDASRYGMMYVDTSDTTNGGLYIYLP